MVYVHAALVFSLIASPLSGAVTDNIRDINDTSRPHEIVMDSNANEVVDQTATLGGWSECDIFVPLGPPPQQPFVTVTGGVADDGLTVVGGTSVPGTQSWRWTPTEGLVGLGDLPGGGVQGWAEGVSATGNVIVGSSTYAGGEFQAYRWTQGSGMQGLGFLPGGTTSNAIAVSNNGMVVVGGSQSARGSEAFRWTPGQGMVGLGTFPGGGAIGDAFAISADGTVIAGWADSFLGIEAFRWTQAQGLQSLGSLSDSPADFACAGSADFSVIGGGAVSDMSSPNLEAFIWTEETGMVGIGDLPGGLFESIVFAMSADGAIAVGRSSIGIEQDAAFIWDPENGIRELLEVLLGLNIDVQGFTSLRRATGISADGRTITGTGFNAAGIEEGWVVHLCALPTPCPGDTNGDNIVNVADLVNVIVGWGRPGGAGDVNQDGSVDVQDLVLVVVNWGPCT